MYGTKRHTIFSVVLLLSAFLPTPSSAGIIRLNADLDRVLNSPDLFQVFVAKIVSGKVRSDFMSQILDVNVSVSSVVYGPGLTAGQEVAFRDAFAWPDNLVPLAAGQRCLILTEKWQNEKEPRIATVVPVCNERVEAVKSPVNVRPLLVKELLSGLKSETSPVRQRLLIRQVTRILPREEAPLLLPYLESKDEWVRRAALAGLVIVGREEKYSNLAADDLRQFFKSHSKDTFIPAFSDFEKRGGDYAPYPLLFDYYYYLHSNPCPRSEEPELVKFLLPLYRAVAEDLKDSPDDRLLHGWGPLHHFGTKEDIPSLYAVHDSRNVHERACCLAAISRMLKLGLTYTNDEDFEKNEQKWQATVKNAVEQLADDKSLK
ncbi:MAG TPA: HEAT repeat domain-containing protein [Planctomycetota bacterium]|jgi:hypothetical protein